MTEVISPESLATQAAYERMRAYMTRPGAHQAKGEDDNCSYAVWEDNDSPVLEVNRCAVGCLLPFNLLAEEEDIEGTGIRFLVERNERVARAVELIDLDFLSGAQTIHDTDGNWDEDGFNFNVEALDYFAAKNHGLKVPDAAVV
jgi:hypothetical protein